MHCGALLLNIMSNVTSTGNGLTSRKCVKLLPGGKHDDI